MKTLYPQSIVKLLRTCLPSDDTIALHEPAFFGNEWKYVKECIDTGWVSSVGKFVDRFEQDLAEFTGMKKAIAVVNGTAALHISLKMVGVETGHEVLVPTLTFIATPNAVTYCGAIPHFIDSSELTLGLDPVKLEHYLREWTQVTPKGCLNKQTGNIIKAVIAVHTFGHPVDLDPLLDVCERFKLELVEDVAEALGSYYKGQHTGHWGKVSAFSFNGNKIVTTGGGGAIVTNDENLAKLAKHITTTAKVQHKWLFVHDQVGYNYRLPNINAALGCAQLEQLPHFIQRKRELALQYAARFKDMEGIRLFLEQPYAKSNYWLNALILEPNYSPMRDEILAITNSEGVMTRPAWTLMHKLPMYVNCPRMDVSTAEKLEKAIINIPSSSNLGGSR